MSGPVRVLIQVQDQTNATVEITLPEELVGEFMSDIASLCECYCDDEDDECDCCDECCCKCECDEESLNSENTCELKEESK